MKLISKLSNKINNLKRKNVLNRISSYKKIDGWLTDNEAVALYLIAKKLGKNSRSLEIGSWKGKSTYCISKGINNGKLIVIDPFNASGGNDSNSEKEYLKKLEKDNSLLETFTSNMEQRNVLDKIIIKRGYSHEFKDEVGLLDFLFIDGDHTIEGCKMDYDLYAKKVKKRGFIAFHDYDVNRPDLGPTYVVHNHVLKSNEFSFYGLFDSLWIGIRLNHD